MKEPVRQTPASGQIVAIVAYRDLLAFEYAVAHELLVRTVPVEVQGWYHCATVSFEGRQLKANAGLRLVADHGPRFMDQADIVIVPGWRDPGERPPMSMLVGVRKAYERGARIVSLCTGAFVLGHAGLLAGRRATTHWLYSELFQKQFPDVLFDPKVLYCDEGQIITSAGNAAAMDALLHLIRSDYSGKVANQSAQRLVLAPHRSGGQAQYLETPVAPDPQHALVPATEWAISRLRHPIGIEEMARRAGMSKRTFHRRFVATIGLTPGLWLIRQRLSKARDLLEASQAPLDEIAECSGFASVDTFRSAFRRHYGLPPAHFRRQNSLQPKLGSLQS